MQSGLRPISANLFGMCFLNSHKIVILSEKHAQISARVTRALDGTESKDPKMFILPMPFGAFQPPEARVQESCGTQLMVMGTSFHEL